jgi:hypothetical protein
MQKISFLVVTAFIATPSLAAEKKAAAESVSREPAANSTLIATGRLTDAGSSTAGVYEVRTVEIAGKICLISFMATRASDGGVSTAVDCFEK